MRQCCADSPASAWLASSWGASCSSPTCRETESRGSSFLARCFERLRARGIEALVSHSDPLPRRDIAGNLVLPGHVGCIYQATNAIYGGRTKARGIWVLPDGTVFSERAMTKVRSRDRGYRYAIDQLVRQGAERPLDLGQDLDAWLREALSRVARRVKHRGNHRYLWALDTRQ